MSQAGLGIPSSEAKQPLPKDGCVNEGVAPEKIAQARVATGECRQVLVRDESHRAGGDGAHAVVHRLQMQALEVRDVTRNVEAEDLALALCGNLEAADKALQHEAASR